MSTRDDSLQLADIKERFETSTLALEEVRRRLGGLADLEERRATASESLTAASEQLTQFTAMTREVIDALQGAQTAASDAFNSMRSVVDGTDLRQISDGVAGIDARLRQAQDTQAQTLKALLESLDQGLGGLLQQAQTNERSIVELQAAQTGVAANLEAKLEALASGLAQVQQTAAERDREFQNLSSELLTKVDDTARLNREKNELAAELEQAQSELAQAREAFTKLSAAAGDRALRKAGLKEGTTGGLFG